MDDLPPLFASGQHLGRYELLQRLAVGGMAEVYLAYAVGPGDFRKVVAIKRLLPQHALDPQLLRMFLDEARLMARLSHPNIPQVTDVDDGKRGDAVEVPFFVMEYVHGTDLRGVLNAAAGPLPIEHALTIASAVAAGLHHAHEHRGGGGQPLEIVHRDVSPSNVLISFDGGVKVTDFGVAKWTEQKSFTHQGQLKGKFAHMSPEQCRGEALDRRSDVFALGTLLYEMTTGDPPFVAESEYELLTQIVSRSAPPPQRPGETYPADLAAIVMRSLERSREDRYQSAQELQLALEAFAREHRLVVSPVALVSYLESLFGARVTEWRQALASGKTLADHLARPDRPSNEAAGQAATRGNERTATDAFALVPTVATTPAKAPVVTNAANGQPPPAEIPTRDAGGRRILAMAGVAALAVALLLVATEMTSRWQRVIRPGMGHIRVVEPALPAPAANVETPAPDTSRHPAPAAAPVLPRIAVFPAPGVTSGVPSLDRRAIDGRSGLRPSRREAGTGSAPTVASTSVASQTRSPASPTERTAGSPAAVASPEADSLPPPAPSPSSPDTPPTGPRTTVERSVPSPAPPPVKVWDPDSPVPP